MTNNLRSRFILSHLLPILLVVPLVTIILLYLLETQILIAEMSENITEKANLIAETVNGLYKAELINRRGPWRSVEQVELETAAWVHWWNTARLHTACDNVPPAEYEAAYWATQQVATAA